MLPPIRFAILATSFFAVCDVAWADQQVDKYDEDICAPSGSAGCVGGWYKKQLVDTEKMIDVDYRRVMNLLPKTYVESLPTQEEFQQLHDSWRAYVTNYCSNYWHFWNGATPWKSAESINCRVRLNRQYLNYLEILGECTGDTFSEACGRLMESCTPVSCVRQPTSTVTK